jgi:hypothetical protein
LDYRLTPSVGIDRRYCFGQDLGLRATDVVGNGTDEAIEIRWFNAIVVN